MSALLALLTAGWAADLDAAGRLETRLHLGIGDCDRAADCRLLDLGDLAVVEGRLSGELSPGVGVGLAGLLRMRPGAELEQVEDTTRSLAIQPLELEVPEAWIELRDVALDGLDLRLGQQRLAWGVAEGIHPVDVVNAVDLRDPTRFDRRLGVPLALARYHRGLSSLELAWQPLHRPARLPTEVGLLVGGEDLFDLSGVGGEDLVLGELETRTTSPDTRVGFASFAGRASLSRGPVDLALVGWTGRESLPQVGGEALLVGFATSSDRVDVGVPVLYPRASLAGVELRSELPLALVGWVEGAVVFPEEVVVTASRAQLEGLEDLGLIDQIPDPLPQTVIQDGEPLGRWVVGMERVSGPLLLNLQWIHGLPTERTRSEVGDYAALGALLTLSDPVRVELRAVSDLQGLLGSAHLEVLHGDAATLRVGATWAGGPEGSTLGQLHVVSNVEVGLETRL